MDNLKEKIKNISKEAAEAEGFFLIDFIFRGTESRRVIEVYVDGVKDVSAEVCATISRKINGIIEEEDLLKGNYRLDVSSPGVERPLLFLEQYHKHLNRKFDISYKLNDDTKTLNGKLVAINGDELSFEEGKNLHIIKFNNISKAKVTISFN